MNIMARYWTQLFQIALVSWVATSWGQDTDSGQPLDPIDRMHSPYIPDHPQSMPGDDPIAEGAKYVEYLKGTIPLIIAVPHGGQDSSDSIPDRTAGCFEGACIYKHNCGVPDYIRCPIETEVDETAREVAMKMRENIVNITGHAPHLVISKLDLKKVDVDMDEARGTFGDVTGNLAWQAYHHAIQEAKDDIGSTSGLLLDLRRHRHPLAKVELGYIIASENLNKDNLMAEDSSIKALASRTRTSFNKLLRGKNSLGGLLEKNSVASVPSPKYPEPNSPYNSDSYTIRVHGSRDSGSVDAILVSSAVPFTSDDEIDSYVHSLSESVVEFMKLYYGSLSSSSVNSQDYKPKASVKAAIVCATFFGCFVVLLLIYVARSRLRRFRIYRYEQFADEV